MHINLRVQKHRNALREAGLRPVQIWVPDTRRPGFVDECRRQSRVVTLVDAQDATIGAFLDGVADDVDGWDE
ncbi:antitoxin MazE family protein [Salmonella enterica]|nr:antitoxin MazE family protein [Salmonella enterica]EKS7253794.1 antitoxin MazE family protein [Salmonella enterica]EKS7272300.1 antitoxin MazE family protein [Salmonella enterica]EKS7281768.1 antitoxin MazE family protein [Salmonella enterica]